MSSISLPSLPAVPLPLDLPLLPPLSSPTPQVVRYTALASGIVYGIVHRKTLQERFDKSAAEKEVQQRAHWLEEAKKAWEAQKLQGKSGGESEDPSERFLARGVARPDAELTLFASSAPRLSVSCSRHRPRSTQLRPRGSPQVVREVDCPIVDAVITKMRLARRGLRWNGVRCRRLWPSGSLSFRSLLLGTTYSLSFALSLRGVERRSRTGYDVTLFATASSTRSLRLGSRYGEHEALVVSRGSRSSSLAKRRRGLTERAQETQASFKLGVVFLQALYR